jgi:hypothetical protein
MWSGGEGIASGGGGWCEDPKLAGRVCSRDEDSSPTGLEEFGGGGQDLTVQRGNARAVDGRW